jgi:leucyl-tRNA synthetase
VGGEMTTNYRLRDWSISRQRYWGCPIPIVYSPEGEAKFVGEENLPWTLPEDVDFVPDGTAPLAKSKELKERTEKLFGKGWTPEVDTMDTFVDSSWYFLRYPDTENEKEFCSAEKLKRWFPIDIYIGGAEHTYMHLLYARFFVKAMYKMGLIEFDEPFMKLRHQGMVLDKDGVKMSKSKGNVVNPNDMVQRFGADSVRTYMMFVAPLADEVAWNEDNIVGVYRFLEKVWKMCTERKLIECGTGSCGEVPKEIPPIFHKTIKKVSEDIENFDFNTAISQMMIFVNECLKHKALPKSAIERFLILLAPFAPHITEELYREVFGHKKSIFLAEWPKYNPEMTKDKVIELVVQVNGKLRDKIEVSADISEDEAREKALISEKIQKFIDGKEVKKVIFVKGKLLNLVV